MKISRKLTNLIIDNSHKMEAVSTAMRLVGTMADLRKESNRLWEMAHDQIKTPVEDRAKPWNLNNKTCEMSLAEPKPSVGTLGAMPPVPEPKAPTSKSQERRMAAQAEAKEETEQEEAKQ